MTLLSPGVEVTIIDEGFYDSSTAGSIPLIIVATAENKTIPAGSGIAPMTTSAKAGKLYQATSQRDLAQAYGYPLFYSSGGTQLHGNELNEYGLLAAYSFLGISSQAYILRADIDLASLAPNSTAPVGAPKNGTYWLDTASTSFGVFVSNGNAVPGYAWQNQDVLVAYDTDTVTGTIDTISVNIPKSTFGSNGDFAIAVQDTNNFLYEKISGSWYKVGSTNWKAHHPTTVSSIVNPGNVTSGHSISINGTIVTFSGGNISTVATDINTAMTTASVTTITASVASGVLTITQTAGGDLTISAVTGTALTVLGITPKTYKGVTLTFTNDASYPTNSVASDIWIKGSSTNQGAKWVLKVYSSSTGSWTTVSVPFYPFNSLVSDGTAGKDAAAISAGLNTAGALYVGYDTTNGVTQLRRHSGVRFEALTYEASATAPVGETPEGTLWYSADFRADIMVSDGINYRGYLNFYPDTNPAGVFVQGSAPTVQSDGTALVDNDLWINTTELANYPRIRRFDVATQRWLLIDNTDQTSPFGIVFADARQDSGVAFTGQTVTGYVYNSEETVDLLQSDYLDPDAPDARTVPSGMLLFNTRYSTYNVKKWVSNYFGLGGWDSDTNYGSTTYTVGGHNYTFPALSSVGRWVTASGNMADGSPYMGYKAQRAVVTKAMAAAVNASDEARSEIINFNIIAAPGYPELIDEMVALNTDQKNTAFVIGDTPARLAPNATLISAWAQNSYGAASNGEIGLTSASPYVGVYYPWGMTSNVDGSDVMVPPSHMALSVYAYNDQVAYPWFAPAGLQRGLITNATSVGYLTSEGEYQTALLNSGLRDALYTVKINPIEYVPNRGLAIMGQKTLSPVSAAMDRVNVARLSNYLAYALDGIAKPFLFQQNDVQTRDSFKNALERFLSGLIGLRAIEDYAVQCDSDNNTRERINRNELWADIIVLPLKAVEFIYIPLRYTSNAI